MLTLLQKIRLKQLRERHAYDLALGKQDGVKLESEKDELDALSMLVISEKVSNVLNEDNVVRDSPVERAEAIACAIKTALQGFIGLRNDKEIAYKLGVVLQDELEKAVKGIDDDRED